MTVLGISADTPEESADFSADLALPFDLLHDEGLHVANAYGVAMAGRDIAVPSIFILDKQGKVTFSHIGENMSDRPNVLVLLKLLREQAEKQ